MQLASSFVSPASFLVGSAVRVRQVRNGLFNRFMATAQENSREFQVIIYGASGFTGEYVAEDFAKYLSKNRVSMKWAVAGRNESKVTSILRDIGTRTGLKLDDVAVVQADVSDVQSLNDMAKRTKVLLNCTGPYRDYGEPIVRACVSNSTNYLDITGEPQFMETMQLNYHKEAEQNGIYIVSACGFDSIPCDIGVNFTRDNFDGKLKSVEGYLNVSESTGNATTWDCVVEGFAHVNDLIAVRGKLFKELFSTVPKEETKLKRKTFLKYEDDRVAGWGLPFPGSDRSVVKRSQCFNFINYKEEPIAFEVYIVQRLISTILMFTMALYLMILTPYKWGRTLLKTYPTFFSFGLFKRSGITREEVRC